MSVHGPWRQRALSFRYALRGLRQLFAEEPNARIHAGVAIAVLLLALWLPVPARDFALLVLTIGMVLALEALNSALEVLGDRVSRERDPLIGRSKDLAAAAVLIGALAAAGTGLVVLGPPLLTVLGVG